MGRGAWLMVAVLAGAVGLLGLACDDDDEPGGGGDVADSGGDGAQTGDTGNGGSGDTAPDTAPDTGDGDTTADAGDAAPDGGGDPCAVGASVSAEMGAEGVALELCSASLTLPAEAVEAGASVTLSVVAPPLDPPFERAFISPVYRIEGDGELAATGELRVLDTSEEGGYRHLAWFVEEDGQEDAWVSFETCPEEDGLSSGLFFFGTFVLIRDVNIYPDGPTGLGDGTMQSVVGEEDPVDWTFEDGYVIHEQGEDGSRSVRIIARRDVEGGLEQLDLVLGQSAEGDIGVIQISLIDTTDPSGGWSWLEPVHGPLTGENTLAVGEDGRIAGSVTTTMHQGELTQDIVVTMDVLSEKFGFPPEGSCFPDG